MCLKRQRVFFISHLQIHSLLLQITIVPRSPLQYEAMEEITEMAEEEARASGQLHVESV